MEPLQYAARVLDLHGAVVETEMVSAANGGETGGLHALLPEQLASRLEWEEETRLAMPSAANADLRPIGYGSADLEKLLDLMRTQCSTIRVRGELPWPNARDLAQEAGSAFRFRTRARMTLQETQPSHASYLLVHYLLSAVSEETYEHVISAMLNKATLAPVSELATQVANRQGFASRDSTGMSHGGSFEKVVHALEGEASRLAGKRLQPFRERLERRRRRDAQRLHDYFQALAREVDLRKARGRRLTPAQVDAKVAAIRAEYERKIRDLDARYALRARLRPTAAMLVDMPVLRTTYHLQWKRAERVLPITWNPLLRRMEPVPCDVCGGGGTEMAIDNALRVRCGMCTES